MGFRRRDLLKVVTSSAAAAVATKLAGRGPAERSAWASAPTRIVRDVCVIGGARLALIRPFSCATSVSP